MTAHGQEVVELTVGGTALTHQHLYN